MAFVKIIIVRKLGFLVAKEPTRVAVGGIPGAPWGMVIGVGIGVHGGRCGATADTSGTMETLVNVYS